MRADYVLIPLRAVGKFDIEHPREQEVTLLREESELYSGFVCESVQGEDEFRLVTAGVFTNGQPREGREIRQVLSGRLRRDSGLNRFGHVFRYGKEARSRRDQLPVGIKRRGQ